MGKSNQREVLSSADLVVSINTLHSSIVIQSFLLILSMKKAVDHN
jgi:hypothetical protein